MIENDKDKPSLEELMHHGVKGMKWGQHKAKPTNSDIKNARINTASRQRELGRAADQLNLVARSGTEAQKKAAVKNYAKKEMDYLKSPDRATALRMTTGEKFIIGALGITGVGLAPAAGFAGARVAVRKLEEKSVKKYNK